MKRSWVGFAILLTLLLASLGITWGMETAHAPVAEALERSSGAVTRQDCQEAGRQFTRAEGLWKKGSPLRRCLADQAFIEEVDAAFARLKVAISLEEQEEFALLCAETAQKITAISHAHALNWGNLF